MWCDQNWPQRLAALFYDAAFVAALAGLPACSSSDFSAGTVGRAQTNTSKPTEIKPQAVSKSLDVFFIGDSHGMVLSEGLPGHCNQSFLWEGRKIFDQKITPAIQKLSPATFTSSITPQFGDILLSTAAQICPESESSFAAIQEKLTCKKTVAGPGPLEGKISLGTAKACGNLFSDQTIFISGEKPIRPINPAPNKTRHLIVSTVKKGSSMPADMFVSIVRQYMGSDTKISIIYPKTTAVCESAGIIPTANDTAWLELPASASGPSNVFEDIATKSGGSTYDLCNQSELYSFGSKP